MRKFVKLISEVIVAILPVIVILVLARAFYSILPPLLGRIIFIVLGIVALAVGLFIFRRVQVLGLKGFLMIIYAQPAYKHLASPKSSRYREQTLPDYKANFKKGKNLFHGGAIRVYGDWLYKAYDNWYRIMDVSYNENSNTLILTLDKSGELIIENPLMVIESSSFLKIENADKITLAREFYNALEDKTQRYYMTYINQGDSIGTKTNIDYCKIRYSLSITEPAVIIVGY